MTTREVAVVEDDREPRWAYHPQLIEIRRRSLEECDRERDEREPVPTVPWSQTSSAVRACANSPRPATISNLPAPGTSTPVRAGRDAGLSWGEDRRGARSAEAAAAPPVPETIAGGLAKCAE
jgi:hypothetical protein